MVLSRSFDAWSRFAHHCRGGPWTLTMVTDSQHLDEEQDPDPHLSEKLDPDSGSAIKPKPCLHCLPIYRGELEHKLLELEYL
jgi:hypothetical protein